MTDISQNAQISSDWFSYFFNSTMLSMIVLDLIVALVILIAHRWFLSNERKINAASVNAITSSASGTIDARLPGITSRPAVAV